MKVTINGKEKQLENEVNVLELLAINDVEMPEMVSVELNGVIVDRDDFGSTIIRENDTIEFLYFMGGGSIGF